MQVGGNMLIWVYLQNYANKMQRLTEFLKAITPAKFLFWLQNLPCSCLPLIILPNLFFSLIPSSYTLYQLVKKCKHLAVINNVLSKQRFLKVYAENKGEIAEADYLVFNFRDACGLTSLVSGTRLIYLSNFCQIPF